MQDSPKIAALRVIEKMADDASLEDIMYESFSQRRVGHGLEELTQEHTVSQEQIKESVAGWLRSVGP